VTWLPFELHPEIPPEGIPREQYFGAGRAAQMDARLQTIAAEVGLTMRSRDRLINTRLALGAAEFAREVGLYGPVHRALFEAHWHQTARIEDLDEVVRTGEAAGLDGAALRQALEEGRYEPVLTRWRTEAEQVGINAIPAHIFGGRYLVMGAQPYEVFQQVLEKL
jgi:predicted DsbA family dithiol-disulfide isomerase